MKNFFLMSQSLTFDIPDLSSMAWSWFVSWTCFLVSVSFAPNLTIYSTLNPFIWSKTPYFACTCAKSLQSCSTLGVTGNFSLGVQNEEGQRLTEFCQEKTLVLENSFLITQEKTTHGHDQMVYTEIRLIIFFVAKDGEVLYNQQKQDWERTVAQIMNITRWSILK